LKGDPNSLPDAVREFVSGMCIVESIIAGDIAYIEYIPKSLEKHIGDIPDTNWEIRIWKAKNKYEVEK